MCGGGGGWLVWISPPPPLEETMSLDDKKQSTLSPKLISLSLSTYTSIYIYIEVFGFNTYMFDIMCQQANEKDVHGGGGDEGERDKYKYAQFRVPLLVSGAALAIVGVILAFTKRSKDVENRKS